MSTTKPIEASYLCGKQKHIFTTFLEIIHNLISFTGLGNCTVQTSYREFSHSQNSLNHVKNTSRCGEY